MASLFGLKRITLAAADLATCPPTLGEIEQLRALLGKSDLAPQPHQNFSRLSKAQLLQLVEELDTSLKDTTLKLNIELENTQAEMVALRERLVESVEARLHLEEELDAARVQRRSLHKTWDQYDSQLAEQRASLESVRHDYAQAQKEIQRLHDNSAEQDGKLSVLYAQSKTLAEQLAAKTKEAEELNAQCLVKDEDISNLRTLIDELEDELREERKKQALASLSNDPVTQKAIQQLAFVILSKDKEKIADERTRTIVQQLFGTNYSTLTSKFEERIKALETQQRDLLLKYRNSVTAQVALVGEMKELLSILDSVQQYTELQDWDNLERQMADINDLTERKEELDLFTEGLQGDEQALSASSRMYLSRQSSKSISSPMLVQSFSSPDVVKLRREADAHKAEVTSLRTQMASVKQENMELWTELEKVRESREEQAEAGRTRWGGIELLTLVQVQAALVEELTFTEE